MDNNPVLILTHNCLELTMRCVDSVRKQDIPTQIVFYDNGSTDGTRAWLESVYFGYGDTLLLEHGNSGVSAGWNNGLDYLFHDKAISHVLVLNNDTEIPSFFYSKLLSFDLPFVTGISVNEVKDHPDAWTQPAESPDFSAFLIRRDCWESVGKFDEQMKIYASDNDYHIRAHQKGFKCMNAGVPFHHERSSTLRFSNPDSQRAISRQADIDRAAFRSKWGCYPWEPGYAKLVEG